MKMQWKWLENGWKNAQKILKNCFKNGSEIANKLPKIAKVVLKMTSKLPNDFDCSKMA